ncbi:MAG: hypothetical protein ABSA82_03020 [Thermacetogeniaceae bacterium]
MHEIPSDAQWRRRIRAMLAPACGRGHGAAGRDGTDVRCVHH